jgi:hypothetical protein
MQEQTENILITTLLELSSKLDKQPIPLDKQIWSIKRCSEYFDVTPEYFAQYIASKPGFPQSAKIGHRKWIGQDVVDWALDHWRRQEVKRKSKS